MTFIRITKPRVEDTHSVDSLISQMRDNSPELTDAYCSAFREGMLFGYQVERSRVQYELEKALDNLKSSIHNPFVTLGKK